MFILYAYFFPTVILRPCFCSASSRPCFCSLSVVYTKYCLFLSIYEEEELAVLGHSILGLSTFDNMRALSFALNLYQRLLLFDHTI